MTTELLPRPDQIDSSMWVSEAIWGHRLYDEQTPWLCFLEFLTVLQSEIQNGRAFVESKPNSLEYTTNTRFYLRNILFNNPHLEAIAAEFPDEESRWKNWCAQMTESCGGITEEADFSYLRQRFASFKDFAHVVKFLRSTSIEGDSNKRWSSKFVFPYGPEALYEDLEVSKTGFTNDRRFFARCGELLYLMIARTSKSADVLALLSSIGVIRTAGAAPSDAQKWNKLIAHLQPSSQRQRDSGKPPYLPYKNAIDFENLANDWLNISRCNMPGYDAIPHLVAIMGLHLIIYFLRRARIVLGQDEQPAFILEILAPKKTVIRDLASDSFLQNNNLSQTAVVEFIDRTTSSPDWQACRQSDDPIMAAAQVLRREFAWPDEDGDEMRNATSPDVLLERLRDAATSRHKKHLFKFHGNWSREIGLSSSRGSRRTRYVPTDALLKSLVFATVPSRMEFQQFLTVLHQKYGFVIGDKQAAELIEKGDADREAFGANATRLEERLASIGLLKRLSDACAYVQNPYLVESN